MDAMMKFSALHKELPRVERSEAVERLERPQY
jgi:hypothetical protein